MATKKTTKKEVAATPEVDKKEAVNVRALTSRIQDLEKDLEQKNNIVVFLANLMLLIANKIKELNPPSKISFIYIVMNIPAIIDLVKSVIEAVKSFNENIRIENEQDEA